MAGTDDFTASIANGLRVEGNERGIEGVRHRRRYRWACNRLLELPDALVILDHGCGAGYGTRMIKEVLEAKRATKSAALVAQRYLGEGMVAGYEPDPAAAIHANSVERVNVFGSFPPPWPMWTATPRAQRCIITYGVLEHIVGTHPSDMLEEFLTHARHVVGFFPYKEPHGNNPNHFWFELDEKVFADLGAKQALYFEPADNPHIAWNDEAAVDAYYEKWEHPRPSAWQSGDNHDPINVLFVLER
jgi:hypothetical protein